MELVEVKNTSPMIVNHWKNKFDKAIRILLKSGVPAETLIAEIQIVNHEKNNQN
jgi:hypothetical protein